MSGYCCQDVTNDKKVMNLCFKSLDKDHEQGLFQDFAQGGKCQVTKFKGGGQVQTTQLVVNDALIQ